MVLKISVEAERSLIERLVPLLIEPAWQNRNRAEAQAIAEATARKAISAAAVGLMARPVRQVDRNVVEV